MPYHISRTFSEDFDALITKLRNTLNNHGFGIITDIDLKATLKNKLDTDIRRYRILGACNPSLALKAVQLEENIGTMLPCNIVVQDIGDNIRISAINPMESMKVINNENIQELAKEVSGILATVINEM